MAGLGSLSANGLARLMMVFGSHRRSAQSDTAKAPESGPEVAPEIALERLEQQYDGTQTGKVVQFRPAGSSGKRRAKAADKAARDAIQQAKNFMVAHVHPVPTGMQQPTCAPYTGST